MMVESLNLFGDVVSPKKEKQGAGAKRRSKSDSAYRTISEVADHLNVATHVLRFWETKFPQIQPVKRGGGRRYYRPEDIQVLEQIQNFLHDKGYTIRGVQALFKENGHLIAEADGSMKNESNGATLVSMQFIDELKGIRRLLD